MVMALLIYLLNYFLINNNKLINNAFYLFPQKLKTLNNILYKNDLF